MIKRTEKKNVGLSKTDYCFVKYKKTNDANKCNSHCKIRCTSPYAAIIQTFLSWDTNVRTVKQDTER